MSETGVYYTHTNLTCEWRRGSEDIEMALTLRARRSRLPNFKVGALMLVLALVLQPLLTANIPIAFANAMNEPAIPPTATISSPARHAYARTITDTLRVTGTFKDDKAVNYLQLELVHAGNLVTVYTMHYSDPGLNDNGNFSIDMPVPVGLASGAYSLYYTGTDFDGSVTTRTERAFFIDNGAPTTTLEYPDMLAANVFTLSGTATDNMSLNRVYIQLVNRQDNKRYGGATKYLSGTQQSWSHQFNATVLNLPEGDYAAHASVVDNAGNTTSQGWTKDFKLDRTMPTITAKTGSGMNDGSKGSAPYYSHVSFKLNDPKGSLKEAVLNGHSYPRANEWNDLNWVNINKSHLNKGENTILVRDRAGNESGELMFVYDPDAPSATITHSNNNDKNLVNSDVTSTLIASEPIMTPEGWTRVDDETFTKVSQSNNKGDMTIIDRAGNSRTMFFEVKRIDKVKPTFDVQDGAVVAGDRLEVTVTEENVNRVTVNGTQVALSGSKPNYKIIIVGAGAQNVIAYDKAGNKSEVTFSLSKTGITSVERTENYVELRGYVRSTDFEHYYCWLTNANGREEGVRDEHCVTTWANDLQRNGNPVTTDTTGTGTVAEPVKLGGVNVNDLPDGTYQANLVAVDRSGARTEPISFGITIANETEVIDTESGQDAGNGPTGTGVGSLDRGLSSDPVTISMNDLPDIFPQAVIANIFNAPSAVIDGSNSQPPVATNESDDEDGDILGTATTANPAANAAVVAPSTEGWKIFGLAWYWWLAIAAGMIGAWLMIAAAIRRMRGTEAV